MDASTIVVGYDGSTHAWNALQTAADLVSDSGTIHVVTAYRMPSPRELDGVWASVPKGLRETFDVIAHPRQHWRTAMDYLTERGIDHTGHFISDRPAGAILDVAKNVGADLIVVGSRGLGHGWRILRRSVSSRIASHASTSFLIIRDAVGDSDCGQSESGQPDNRVTDMST